MTVHVTYQRGSEVKTDTMTGVKTPGIGVGGLFLQFAEMGSNRLIRMLPLSVIIDLTFEDNAIETIAH